MVRDPFKSPLVSGAHPIDSNPNRPVVRQIISRVSLAWKTRWPLGAPSPDLRPLDYTSDNFQVSSVSHIALSTKVQKSITRKSMLNPISLASAERKPENVLKAGVFFPKNGGKQKSRRYFLSQNVEKTKKKDTKKIGPRSNFVPPMGRSWLRHWCHVTKKIFCWFCLPRAKRAKFFPLLPFENPEKVISGNFGGCKICKVSKAQKS